ncbi:ATP-binding protein [Rhodopseudomonas sp. P2A-2r]|uniref:ATP-binding protein n=1 Tax=unclassified Rhodopseudomonas TaxID=2638247 RepID=UPI002234235E|nr:ATP-binding protein [Rhodopseudomonas sp. P2A-2r]UZE47617.1 ATP-binding protein [Rhodopseudomonas sp. P2A-2r]
MIAMTVEYPIQSTQVRQLSKLVEESTRATGDSVKYFIEPTPGVLDKAKNKRHHIIFGRRGSGKSSLLHKVASDLTISRTPIAYVDLEQFKGHSYPDVLISVLISTLTEFKKWLDTAATNPATKKTFWMKFFGSIPSKGAFPKRNTASLSAQFEAMIELHPVLLTPA